jgi:hypothetical protein
MSSGNGALCTLYGLTIKLLRPLSSPDVQTSTGSGSSLRLRLGCVRIRWIWQADYRTDITVM